MPISGLKSLQKKVRSAKRDLQRKPEKTAQRYAALIVAEMKRLVAQNDAYASGHLFRGIHYRNNGREIIIESTAPYSGFVEFGTGPKHIANPYTRRYRKPNFTPSLIGAIINWAKIKPTFVTNDPVSSGIAVARSISGEDGSVGGTEPQPFFIPSWQLYRGAMITAIGDDVGDAF